jgi:poly-beta-1,6-N-acetyl-D-glucosamine N-deacetylase
MFLLVLGGTTYGFVLKSFPYEVPQDAPPEITLTAANAAAFTPYPSGLPAVPVLAWRDVSERKGVLVTPPATFARQLAVLRRYGYRSVSLGQLRALTTGRRAQLPGRPVLLTFDDGLSTDWTVVDPILRRYGFSAVVMINPGNVATKTPSYFLTRGELATMAASGRWDVGVELPGNWETPGQARQAAANAKAMLAADTGRPVTAFGWPVQAYPTKTGTAEPAVTYQALRSQFPVVFGRPGSGPAGFATPGSAGAPLPRVNFIARDTAASLSVRLRSGVPAPLPRDVLSLPWQATGGRCLVGKRGIAVKAPAYALCTVIANGDQWTSYRLSMTVSGRAGSTAILELRASRVGAIEVAVGASTVSIKERIDGTWHSLRKVRVLPPKAGYAAAQRGSKPGPTLIGGGTVRLAITLDSSELSLRIQRSAPRSGAAGLTDTGSVKVGESLAPQLRNGLIAFGMVGDGEPGTVAFRQLRVVSGG